MDIRKLAEGIAIAPQLQPGDMAALAKAGYGTIICNRPDGEAPDQPGHAEMTAAAQAAGLEYVYIPISGGEFSEASIAAFAAALHDQPGPAVAYCRSGARSTTLWALSQADKLPAEDILNAAANAGIDAMAIAPRLKARKG